MANYQSTRDLKRAVLINAGEPDDGSSQYDDRVVTYLNKFYLGVHAGSSVFNIDCSGAWSWAKADFNGSLILKPPFSSGEAILQSESNQATITDPPSFDPTGQTFHASGDNEVYRIIKSEAGNTLLTFDSVYIGSSGQKTFRIYQLEYDLRPNGDQRIMRLVDGFFVQNALRNTGISDHSGKINLVEESSLTSYMGSRFPQCGYPSLAAEIKDRDGIKTIRFSHWVSSQTKLTYSYIPVPNDLVDSDTDIPNLPREFRDFLESAATAKLLTDKDDNRSDHYIAVARATLQSLVRAENVERQMTSSRRGELIPRSNQVPFLRKWI